jgi:hypothetical protein
VFSLSLGLGIYYVVIECMLYVFPRSALCAFFFVVDRYRRGFAFSKQSHFICEIKKKLSALSNSFISPFILH